MIGKDLAKSPVIGSRNIGSPLALASSLNTVSPTAGKADVWPTQGDEDIDRLVAMHQKRRHNSLSSLGVSLLTSLYLHVHLM